MAGPRGRIQAFVTVVDLCLATTGKCPETTSCGETAGRIILGLMCTVSSVGANNRGLQFLTAPATGLFLRIAAMVSDDLSASRICPYNEFALSNLEFDVSLGIRRGNEETSACHEANNIDPGSRVTLPTDEGRFHQWRAESSAGTRARDTDG
jgi:hypothetical protein